jgi:hypothetical protein
MAIFVTNSEKIGPLWLIFRIGEMPVFAISGTPCYEIRTNREISLSRKIEDDLRL